MEQYIPKSAVVAEIEKRWRSLADKNVKANGKYDIEIYTLLSIKTFLDIFEAIDPHKQRVQYASIKDGIKAHAVVYFFNIQSELFNQLTIEQQKLWRKEIEQACISGGHAGVELARDKRYKENVEVKGVDFESEIDKFFGMYRKDGKTYDIKDNEECVDWKTDCNPEFEKSFAKYFFELGLKARKEN